MVLYFGKREDSDDLLKQVDLGEMAAAELVLPLRIAKPEQAAKPSASFVPAAKLAQSDLWSAYSVEKEDVFIVADKYGNEFKRTESRELAAIAREVAAHFREVRKQLKVEVAAIEKSLDAGKLDDALAGLRGVFARGVVGYPECNAASALHDRALTEGRKLLEKSRSDSNKLKAMATIWRDTALSAEIDQAIKALSPTADK